MHQYIITAFGEHGDIHWLKKSQVLGASKPDVNPEIAGKYNNLAS